MTDQHGLAKREGVAFLINQLGVGGAERVFVDDANMLVRHGYRVVLFALYGTREVQALLPDLDTRVEFVCLGARSPFDWRAASRVARMLRERGIARLVSTLNDANIAARWVVLAGGLRTRLYLREANDPRRKPRWQRVLDMLLDPLVTGVIAVTRQARDALVREAPWRARKIVVLHNAVDIPTPRTRNDHDIPHILTVGSLTVQKDHHTLISALQELADEGLGFETGIVGGGSLEQDLKRAAVPLESRVRFTGKLPHDATMRAFEEADIFVLSSKWEGCPNVVLEAMAHGLPVVATAVGGIPELVDDGATGILVPPGSPHALAAGLRALVLDPAQRRALGDAGAALAKERHSREVRFARLTDILGFAR